MNETPKNKSCWQILRRILIGLAILATLIAIFYTKEDWRGKRTWENCKRELEAKGLVLDWEKFIPPPVPDDRNFFKASKKIAYSFVKSTNDAQAEFFAKQVRYQFGPTESNSFPILDTAKTWPIVVATISVISPGSGTLESESNRLVLKLSDPAARSKAGQLIQNTIGRSANGSQGFKFSEFQLTDLNPAQIILQADPPPSIAELENLISADASITNIGYLRVEATGAKEVFQVLLTGVRVTAAADYLKWSDQYEPDFDEIREALKRPYAQIEGDYSNPFSVPIPNFVMLRSLAQTLAQRTQCYLLLGQPEKALRELTLLNNSRRITEVGPTGMPMTLVNSMINVAIAGLYADTVAYGLQSHFWREPQLTALQEELKDINLPPFVAESLREEPVYSSRWLETATPTSLAEMLSHQTSKNLWQKWTNPEFLLYYSIPRGWIYQTMAVVITPGQRWLAGFDLTNNLVLPGKSENALHETEAALGHWSPWKKWARLTVPNITKAILTTAKNQTLVNQGQIVCALERFRLAHGDYPDTIDALVPQFIETPPHDIIGGQPLHYRRTADGKFQLYSVGWNETDDGGQVALKKDGSEDRENGDWVWKN